SPLPSLRQRTQQGMVFTVMVSCVSCGHHRHRSTRIFQHKVSHHVPHILTTSISRNLPSLPQKKRGHLGFFAQLPECPAFPFQFCFSHQRHPFARKIALPEDQ